MNKRLLIIAGALSAFALVFLGSVFAKMQERTVAENHPTAQLSAQQFGAPSDSGTQLAPAPSALAPAQAQAANTPSLSNPQNPSVTPPTPSTRLSGAQAQQLAQQVQPSARLQGTPELVRYGGRLAYEVPFAQGKIYVNAESGAILGNSMAQSTQAVQPNYRGDEYDDDDEHEYREHRKKREHKKHDQDEDDHNEHEERENV